MENRKFDERRESEIVYSRSVKAGKRIYYLDVKKDRTGDHYLCITVDDVIAYVKSQVGEIESRREWVPEDGEKAEETKAEENAAEPEKKRGLLDRLMGKD